MRRASPPSTSPPPRSLPPLESSKEDLPSRMIPSQQPHVTRLFRRSRRKLFELLSPLRELLELLGEVGDLTRLCGLSRLGGGRGRVGHR
jgi:hypothetical protein